MARLSWSGRKVSKVRREILAEHGYVEGAPWNLYVSGQGVGLDAELQQLGDEARGPVVGLLGSNPLVSKRDMWIAMVQRYGRGSASCLTPETWVLDHEPDRRRLAQEQGPFIVKQAGKQRRKGISLATSAAQALQLREGVVQPVLPSMQVAGRAFHVRVYAIAKAEAWYLHRHTKVIYAPVGQPVTLASEGVPPGAPSTLDELLPHFADPEDARDVLGDIPRNLKKVLTTFRLRAPKAATSAAMPFGVDVLIEPSGVVRIIEVNRRPNLTGTDAADAARKRRVWEDTLRAAGALGGKMLADRLVAV
ncbi:MAG: tubulin--tyrosine ligase family protein [Proteobacteria bacterium]|nr:tubulin--tyrosine ligase family protein [Pseudomonadota bacterium]MCP4918145.1 tubulin--tyrosine ligase family protein [Pseudomonadota bacterium]